MESDIVRLGRTHKFSNGYTATKEIGRKPDGKSIQGRWVLRNPDGQYVATKSNLRILLKERGIAEYKNKFIVEVGKTYHQLSGDKVLIRYKLDSEDALFQEGFMFVGSNGLFYNSEGMAYKKAPGSYYHLVCGLGLYYFS